MEKKEIRASLAGCEIRAAPGENGELRFSGYAAKFGTWSEDLGGFRETIRAGAFRASIAAGDDVRCLMNHDPNYVLGRTRSGTLKLEEDGTGLRFEVTAPDASWARDLRASVERGDIDQCSFAFEAEEQEWKLLEDRNTPDERTLVKCKLYDVSIVTYPAYPDTEASARSHEAAVAEARERKDAARKARRGTLRKKMELKEKEWRT